MNVPSPGLSHTEEVVNAITHGCGFLASVVAAVALMLLVFATGDAWRVVGCALYAASLVSVYGMSTLSHSVRTQRWRQFFRKLDQAFIYLLIVATYTPFSVTYLRSLPWWTFLGLMWLLALIGFVSKIHFAHRIEAVSVGLYVALGWMPIFSAPTLVELAPAGAMWWVLVGGLCYTFGTVFLVYDARFPHFHAVWHLLVIAGSACHYFPIVQFVARGY